MWRPPTWNSKPLSDNELIKLLRKLFSAPGKIVKRHGLSIRIMRRPPKGPKERLPRKYKRRELSKKRKR
jgi:hypothetical protein